MRSYVHVVASMYAPIAYPPSTALVFRPPEGFSGGHPELVATESLLSVNPNRMVIKRVLLSGHPYRIYKRFAVLRYLFFYPGLPYI